MKKSVMQYPMLKAVVKKALYAMMIFAGLSASSCGSRTTQPIQVNPDVLVLNPNLENDVTLNATLTLPGNYISKRGMVTIEPQLILGDQVARSFQPITLMGKVYEKKLARQNALAHVKYRTNKNSVVKYPKKDYSVNLREVVHLDQNFETGKIIALVNKDGCDCHGQDTVVVAYLSDLSSLIDADNLLIQWVDVLPPDTTKEVKGEGTARLQFVLNKWDIVPELANNAAEMDSMLSKLIPVFTDSLATFTGMTIQGYASAEGPYDHNVELAENRAKSALDWVSERFNLTPSQKKLVKIGSRPEGWWPVIASMHAAGNPDSVAVKSIVMEFPNVKSQDAERRIRKLECWPEIVEKHLAKDRKVDYTYSYILRSFVTDEEKLEMFDKRPDAFNENEFLSVAKLKENNLDSLIFVYETLVKYIPKSEIGINNLAALYYDNGMYEKAMRLLESYPNPTPDMITTLAVCYTKMGDDDRAMKLLEGLYTDNAIYNLGVIQANNHNMVDAYINLLPAQDLNSAIAALGVDENEDAWRILNALDDDSDKANYVRAIAKARLGDYDESLKYLRKACENPKYRERAMNEADFKPLEKLYNFQQIINR